MRYILNPHIALRSWQLVPYAYYIKGERNAKGLQAEEFAFLSSCDGKTELPSPEESPLARRFLDDGFIRRAESGEALSDWSRPRLCLNRYFPAMNWISSIRIISILRNLFRKSSIFSKRIELINSFVKVSAVI